MPTPPRRPSDASKNPKQLRLEPCARTPGQQHPLDPQPSWPDRPAVRRSRAEPRTRRRFQVDNTSDAYYDSPYYAQHAKRGAGGPGRPAGRAVNLAGRRSAPTSSRRSSPATRSPSTRRRHGRLVELGDPARGGGGRRDGRRPGRRGRRRAGIHLPPRRRDLQLRRGRVLLRPVLRALPRLRPADLRDPRQPRRRGHLHRTAAPHRTSRPCRRSSPTSAPRAGQAARMRAAWRARR